MALSREYLLFSPNPVAWDHPGEVASTIKNERIRPDGTGDALDECIRFVHFSNRYYNGVIGFDTENEAGGRSWLLGIELMFSRALTAAGERDARREPSAGRIRIKVKLNINPTRIIAHAMSRGLDLHTAGWRDLLTTTAEEMEALRALTLDRTDNVLPPSAFSQSVAPNHWVDLAAACVRSAESFLYYLLISDNPRTDITRAGQLTLSSPQSSWNIGAAEVYQEFGQIDAADYVRGMLPAIRQMSSAFSARFWQRDERTPVSYKSRLTSLQDLSLYAKTHDRIRVEIKYLKRVPTFSEVGFEGRLRRLAEAASTRIDEVREAIVIRMPSTAGPASLAEAVDKLCELSDRLARFFSDVPMLHARVLGILLTRGAVDAGRGCIVSTAVANQLVRLQILQRDRLAHPSRRDNCFPLSSRYASLCQLFREAEYATVPVLTDA